MRPAWQDRIMRPEITANSAVTASRITAYEAADPE